MKILVINGPNINLLGKREPKIYGTLSYDKLIEIIKNRAHDIKIEVDCYQNNSEGKIINKIHEALNIYDGIIINPAGYSHYSVAILDAIKAISIPTIEVHLSNIYKREKTRKTSVTVEGCIGQITGFGHYGYLMALEYFNELESNK